MQKLKVIKLSGSLGRRFGVFHKFAVESYPEAIRALCSQVKGFREFMTSHVGQSSPFAVFVDGENVGPNQNYKFKCAREVRIVPIPRGRKSGGLLQIALGVALIAVAAFMPGISIAASNAIFAIGAASAIGGVVQLLSPQNAAYSSSQSNENTASYAFGGAVNTVAAGNPIPLPYGYRANGGVILSAGTYASDNV